MKLFDNNIFHELVLWERTLYKNLWRCQDEVRWDVKEQPQLAQLRRMKLKLAVSGFTS